jgi:type II secretory pathway component PulL
MGRAVGLYFENGDVRVAEISGTARSMRINRIVREHVIGAEGRASAEKLRDFFERNRLARDNVVLCLSGRDSILRKVTLPLSNLRQIERTVKFQVEKYLFDESLENVVVDFFPITQSKTETEVFLLAIKKEELRQRLHTLEEAGITPVGVTLDSIAVFNLVAAAGGFPRHGYAAMLEFSTDACRIVLVSDGRLLFLRNLNIAGMAPDEIAETVARDLQSSCVIAGVCGPLAHVLISGDGIGGAAYQALSRRFGSEIGAFNPFKAFPSRTTEEENGGADDASSAALGAALKGIRAEAVQVDFQKEEFALRSGFDFVRNKLVYLFGALAILFGFLCAHSYYEAGRRQNYLNEIEGEAARYWKKIFPKKPFPANTFDKWIKAKALDNGAAPQGLRYHSFLEALRAVAEVLPPQRTAAVRAITFDQKRLVLAGDAESFEEFHALVSSLRNLKTYKISEKFEKRGRPGAEQRLSFSIELVPLGEVK